ncbi:hypothetical protein [Butyrivibrio sp. M55]|uniref:hypothetical protein n=1 Tax=Butyrivibrio sp. M55 TaxID=1855323 RepID=UPI0008E0B576|nr:hypothetical protein [Butyrivibrio sp. M55]SFU91284.1 hypothetical protein SAMN05216540_12052 [Butyrivibrio sp. M55]
MKRNIIVSTSYGNSCMYEARMKRKREFRTSTPGLYRKFYVEEIETGRRTTAITLSRGRIAVGDDVWRMSNRNDMCEYPYKIVEGEIFKLFYKEVAGKIEIPIIVEEVDDKRDIV